MIRDPFTWKEKIFLDVQPQASAAEADLAALKGHNLRAHIDTVIASAGSNSQDELEDSMWDTRLVLFITKTRRGRACGPQPSLPKIDSVQLAEVPDSGSLYSLEKQMAAGDDN